jgi:hypothetical protein
MALPLTNLVETVDKTFDFQAWDQQTKSSRALPPSECGVQLSTPVTVTISQL